MSLPVGASIAGYTVLRLLGEGGMGAVYLVQHPQLPRREVIKVMHVGLAAQPALRSRFIHEAQLAARLDHPNVVQVYDQGVQDDLLWIRMQYVEGADLAEELRSGPFTVDRTLTVLDRVGSALDHAHRAGLLHRDVKPANVLLATGHHPGEPGQVYLTDFGIAKALDADAGLTSTGQSFFSPAYAAPEVFGDVPLDTRVDVYALGCVLHEMLTGHRPFSRETPIALISAHVHEPPPDPRARRPSLPPAISTVVATAMAKDRTQRYPTCRALVDAATTALRHGPAPSRVDSTRREDSDPAHLPGPYRLTVRARRAGTKDFHVLGELDTARLVPDMQREVDLLVRQASAERSHSIGVDTARSGSMAVQLIVTSPTGTRHIEYVADGVGAPAVWQRLTDVVIGPEGRARLQELGRARRVSPLVLGGVAVAAVVAAAGIVLAVVVRGSGNGGTAGATDAVVTEEQVETFLARDVAEAIQKQVEDTTGADVALDCDDDLPVVSGSSIRCELLEYSTELRFGVSVTSAGPDIANLQWQVDDRPLPD